MFALIASLVGILAVGAFIWQHDASVAKDAAAKQRAADEKVYNVCVADKDRAVGENAKMALSLKAYGDQVAEQNAALAKMDALTLTLRKVQVANAVKAQTKVNALNAENVDLEVALKQRNETMTCDPRILAQLKAALSQQRRDHPVTAEEAKSIFGIDKPVTIRPKP